MTDWDRMQAEATERLIESANKHTAVVGAAVTGAGKSTMAAKLVKEWAVPGNLTWELVTNRRILVKQLTDEFAEKEIEFGVRASGYPADLHKPGQITIAQTDAKACKSGRWEPHRPDILLIDEVHNNIGRHMRDKIERQKRDGCIVVGLTATPVGLGGLFNKLEDLCSLSRLRSVGGALIAHCTSAHEVDLKDIRKIPAKERDGVIGKRVMHQQIVGNVISEWKKQNPLGLPTIQFNPDIESSMWMCEQWNAAGIKSCHIDGNSIYYGQRDSDGNRILIPSRNSTREVMRRQSQRGEIVVINSRFVLREGWNAPWVFAAIYATRMGSVVPWVQSAGRVLRSYKDMKHVVLIDHAGNLLQPELGSVNADREWSLEDTAKSIAAEAMRKVKSGEEKQPVVCPKCHRVVKWETWTSLGNSCPHCRAAFSASQRTIIQTDGTLRVVTGDAIRIKVKTQRGDVQAAWNKVYFPSKNSKSPRASTFKQIVGRFNKTYPDYLVTSGYVSVNGQRTKVSGIKNVATGEFFAINNIPHPNSPVWKQTVRGTKADALQHGHAVTNEPERPVPGNQSKKKAESRRPADRDLFNQGE